MRTLSSQRDESRGLPSAVEPNGECGTVVLDGGGDEARRRTDRFDGTRKIQGLRQFDRRLDRYRLVRGKGRRQHEGNRSSQRAVGIMAARHGASRHSRHVMPAIHVIRRCCRSSLMMMRSNRALTGHAARGYIVRPCRARERRVQQYDHEQTDACGNRTPPILTRYLHVVRVPISVARHYSVKRHSLQATPKLAAPGAQSTIRRCPGYFAMSLPIWW
jgi:hypothetical protein